MEIIDVWVVEYDCNGWTIDEICVEKQMAERIAKNINAGGTYTGRVRHATLRFDEEPQP